MYRNYLDKACFAHDAAYSDSKDYTENFSRETFIIDSVLKTNPWTYKLKDLNGEKIIGSFYEKELLQSTL